MFNDGRRASQTDKKQVHDLLVRQISNFYAIYIGGH